MWTRSTSANGTARTSPHGGFAAWFSFSSSLVVNGSVHKSSRVRTASGVTPAALSFLRRSEEHTSELQSRLHLVCRLLLEKKKKQQITLQHAVAHVGTNSSDGD